MMRPVATRVPCVDPGVWSRSKAHVLQPVRSAQEMPRPRWRGVHGRDTVRVGAAVTTARAKGGPMNHAKKQLERLTHGWYGAVAVAAALGFVFMSTGLVATIIGLVLSFAIVTVIGRKLASGSNAMRLFCLAMSALGLLGHGWGVYRSTLIFFSTFTLMYLSTALLSALYVYMSLRSLRVLARKDVREHCEG